jgi:phospholipid/cholesterol/gamma-HCH transport system substrate-binding protein
MKTTSGNKIRLGIFISISMAVFIATIYFIGQKQQLFNSTFHISGIFKNVSGLQAGNNVRFCGIDVGMIEDIEQVTDSTVRVDMVIDEQARKFIKKNARAIIGSDGLMGNKMMLLVAGTPGKSELSDMDTIETTQPVNMDDILLSLKVTADNSARITDDLAMIMNNISEGKGTIGKLFMDSTFARNVDEAMVNIKQGAGGFKQNMDAASHNFLLKGYLKKKKNVTDKTKK